MLGKVAFATAVSSAGLVIAVTIGITTVFADSGDNGDGDDVAVCARQSIQADSSAVDLDTEQTAVARTVIAEGLAAGVPVRGLVVALATAAVESGVRNLDYGDRDSLGVFQQRPSAGWGTPEQLIDVSYAARAFFGGPDGPNSYGSGSEPPGLIDIDGWEHMSIGDAAQAVQRSAFPDRYTEWEDQARTWVAALTDTPLECVSPPIADGGYQITSRFGWREHPVTGEWKLHDGTDFSAPTGTPVLAIAPGDVTSVGFAPWAGPHLVEIDHGDGHVSVYGHMNAATVGVGDTVTAGQQVGAVGSQGLSTGPHLHLTIRRDGQPINPEAWFEGHDLEL